MHRRTGLGLTRGKDRFEHAISEHALPPELGKQSRLVFRIRFGNAANVREPRRFMYPARKMTSAWDRCSAPQIAASRESPLECVTDERWNVSMSAAAARRNAPEALLLLITTTTRPLMRPCTQASIID